MVGCCGFAGVCACVSVHLTLSCPMDEIVADTVVSIQ
jgi:hypothetical protein